MTLYYSLYHPSLLMMSRQCYFLQTAGCQQKTVTRHCLTQCSRNTSLINLNNETFVIDKQKGAYNCIYDERPYFNSEVVADFPQKFSKWVIDLRAVGVNPQALGDKS